MDPDVYYCRSHIVRRSDTAAAAADLKRYVALSEAPGTIHFRDKTERIRKEIELLERGEIPPDWDRPGGPKGGLYRVRFLLGAGVLLVLFALVWQRSRRRREVVADGDLG